RRVRVQLEINGERRETEVWPGESLLFTLRERLGLPGSKNACEQGECGSCSALLDGELVCACLVLAAQADGRAVVTVEGLRRDGEAVRRRDAVPKVAGEFAYASDLHAAGMLWGATVRSPHAHARIAAIDVSEAVRLPGVHAVLTHEDVPGQRRYGLEFPDQPV